MFGPIDWVKEETGEQLDMACIDPTTGNRGEAGVGQHSGSQGQCGQGGAAFGVARVFSAYTSAKAQSFFDLTLTDATGSGKSHTDVSLSFFLDGSLSFSGVGSKNWEGYRFPMRLSQPTTPLSHSRRGFLKTWNTEVQI